MTKESSRRRFGDYRKKLKQRSNQSQQRKSAQPDDKSQPPDKPQSDGKSQPVTRSSRTLFLQFLSLLRGFRLTIAFALGTLTIATVLKLVPPVGIKLVVDYVLTDEPLPAGFTSWLPLPQSRVALLFWIGGAIVCLSVISTAIHLWGRWFATKTVNQVQVTVRRRVFEHAVRLPLHRVYELKSGGAASLLREDAGGVADLIFSMLYNPWRAVVQLVGSLILLVLVDWRMMLAGLTLIPIVYVTHRTWISRIRPMHRDVRAQRQDIDSLSTEAFGGMRVVRAFGREKSETGRFVRGNNLLIRQQLFVWWWTRMIEIIWALLIPLASTGLLIYGGYRILQGQMTMGDLTMFLFYLAMLLEPLATLASSATAFQNQLAGLDRVLDLMEEPSELAMSRQPQSPARHRGAGRLTFHDVHFHYPTSSQMVLKGIDLEVPPGTTVALVGRSGAGKTTLTNLVARFYDPTSGHIELDGVDLRDINVDAYRSQLGIVEQDVFLFDGTVADNIGYAVRRPDPESIVRAARAANAHEFITALEKGYDTVIGERGVKLSGGQRQRLAIARALLANPRILILDEATSNLDTESEGLIQQSLRTLLEDRTCFVIAHRLSTVSHADQIVVLQEGQIIEIGTHRQLMSQSGRYRRMVDLQTGPTQDGSPVAAGDSRA